MIINFRFIRLSVCFYGLIQLSVIGQYNIIGTWELVFVAPINFDDTDPWE